MIIRPSLQLAAIAAIAVLAGCGQEKEPEATSVIRRPPSTNAPSAPSPKPPLPPEPKASEPSAEVSPLAQAVRYAPQDDCHGQPGWPTFRDALVASIRGRNAQGLAKLSAPDIALDYGGGSGPAELIRRLKEPDSRLWQELDAILPLGCAMQGGLAAMPWVFWNVPDDIDSYSAMLVLDEDTPLLEKAGGKPFANAGWVIVGIDPLNFDNNSRFTRVTTHQGIKGWVETRKLRSLLDYRLIAEPKDGQWQITAFIAGD